MLRLRLRCKFWRGHACAQKLASRTSEAPSHLRSDRDGPNELEEKEENALLQVGRHRSGLTSRQVHQRLPWPAAGDALEQQF